MNVLDALLQRFRDKIMRFRTALDRFNNDTAETEKVGPNWNVRDLVGHLVYWTTEGADRLPEIAKASVGWVELDDDEANTRAAMAALPVYDIERINADVFKKYRRMSYVMLLPQLRAAEEKFLSALSRVEPKLLVGETPVRMWINIYLEHYDHHWTGLKAAMERLR